MNGLLNDCLRRLISVVIKWSGLVLTIAQRAQASVFFWNQNRFTRMYGITPDTPVLTFRRELELLIEKAARADNRARLAWT